MATYEAGFDKEGNMLALDVKMYADGGSTDGATKNIMDRALTHVTNA